MRQPPPLWPTLPPRLRHAPAGLPRQFAVEARVMTRRESTEKRHKRIRSKVCGGRAGGGAVPASVARRRLRLPSGWLHPSSKTQCLSFTTVLMRAGGGHPRAAPPRGVPLKQPHLCAGARGGDRGQPPRSFALCVHGSEASRAAFQLGLGVVLGGGVTRCPSFPRCGGAHHLRAPTPSPLRR